MSANQKLPCAVQVVIAGLSTSGTTITSKTLATRFGLRHYSGGDFMRQLAVEAGYPEKHQFPDFLKHIEGDARWDKLVDGRAVKLANTETNFVYESRLGRLFVPKAFKVFLYCDPEIRIQRNAETRQGGNLQKARADVLGRDERDRARYEQMYHLNQDLYPELWEVAPASMANIHNFFDCVVDTGKYGIEETVNRIASALEAHCQTHSVSRATFPGSPEQLDLLLR